MIRWIALWQTGQKVGYSLVRMQSRMPGDKYLWLSSLLPSYTPMGYLALFATGVGTGVALVSISSHLEAKLMRVVMFCSHGSMLRG